MPDFLLEIGCEEIPARMISFAQGDLEGRVSELLVREHLSLAGVVTSLDTPRRLAVLASDILAVQPDAVEQITGPAASIAFREGQPTPAAHAFAKKAGIEIAQLERVTTPKGEYLSATVRKKGRSAAAILAELLPKEINSIYWPKNMYWRKRGEVFVRPVRWLVAMLDEEIIPLEFDGIMAGNQSRGHRLLSDGPIKVAKAGSSYISALEQAKVLGRGARENQIRKALDAATRTIPGARWREDKALLDTVVNLTEWPSVILGNFEAEFLVLPEEVLVTVMRDHQKYFAVEDANGKLLPHFLAVLNTDGDAQGIIRHGHERVLRARFNDARFFWQTDQKHPLRERLQWLKTVTFQKDLGSYHQKTLRVQRLASSMSANIKNNGLEVRSGIVHKAIGMAKADLTTELVKEFTELQGIVGGLYASVQELDEGMPDANRQAIATAIYDQYKPESMDDSVPRTVEGAVVSVADKADSITGMFSLGLLPTGSKDPFALRRQANGIVRILCEKQIPLGLAELLSLAASAFCSKEQYIVVKDSLHNILRPLGPNGVFVSAKVWEETEVTAPPLALAHNLGSFFKERLQFYLRDHLGFRFDIVTAVTAANSDDVFSAKQRAEAISAIVNTPEFTSIAIAFKRMHNIIRQANEKRFQPATELRKDIFTDVERDLYKEMQPIGTAFIHSVQAHKYEEALRTLIALAPRVDAFFEHVMVMADDPEVRSNRLLLLNQLGRSFSGIADFSEIVTEGSKESPK